MDGLPGYGISKDAWLAAVAAGVISKALVVDMIDKQDNGFAQKTFSAEVSDAMRKAGYEREAAFCDLIRNW